MNVLGFQEASDNSLQVLISDNPEVKCSVVTPEGLMILKLISRADRAREKRKKDAGDIRYVLSTYLQVKNVKEDIYNDEQTGDLEIFDWDPDLAACSLPGRECSKISTVETTTEILKLKDTNNPKNIEQIAEDMDDGIAEKNLQMLAAFMYGYGAKQ